MLEAILISVIALLIIWSIAHWGGLTGMIVAFVAVLGFHIIYRIIKGHWFE